MIQTNRLDYKKDLEEVVFMFTSGEDLTITHYQEENGGVFTDNFTINGKSYTFKNQQKTTSSLEYKRYEKRFSKLSLYKILSEIYNEKLPWGALTGIRPTKMAYTLSGDFESVFKNVFEVTDEKIELVKKIIKTQCKIIDRKGDFNCFYVGVPFCPTKCAYCSFSSMEIEKAGNVSAYVDGLIKEINESIKLLKNNRSVYVGGGTPTCLTCYDLDRLLSAIDPLIKSGVEYTVEAGRPDAISKEKLDVLKTHGVTRVCVNPQTFNEKTLSVIGRKHGFKDTIDSYNLVKSYGFLINMDLIAGLPNETFSDFKFSLEQAINLNPDNITVHTLCLKKGAKLKEKTNRLLVLEINEMINFAYNELTKNGYNPYYLYRQKFMAGNLENTGYSKKGAECVYNIDVMEENTSNVACGAGSVSKAVDLKNNKIERYGAPKDIKTYIEKVDEIIKNKKELFNNL